MRKEKEGQEERTKSRYPCFYCYSLMYLVTISDDVYNVSKVARQHHKVKFASISAIELKFENDLFSVRNF